MLINPIANFNINLNKKALVKAPISPVKLQLKPQLQKDTISFTGAKKQPSLTYEQKRQYILDKGKLAFNSKMIEGKDEAFLDRAIAIIERENDTENAVIIAGYDEKGYKRALELVDKGVVPYRAKTIALLDDRAYEKTLYLINKKVPTGTAEYIGEFDDKKYAKALTLMKKGMSADNAYFCAKYYERAYQRVLDLLDRGENPYSIAQVCNLNNEDYNEILSLLEEGANLFDALEIQKKEDSRRNYNNFKEWLGGKNASVIANFKYLELMNLGQIQSLSEIIDTIRKNSGDSTELSKDLSDFFQRNNFDDINIGDFKEYVKQIDFKNLRQIYPTIKKYTSKEILTFLEWHYEIGTTDFSQEDLVFTENLSEYLAMYHINSKQMNDILVACPLTKREVGEIPSDWLTKTEDKEKAVQEIYKAIGEFVKKPNSKDLSEKLSSILNKTTEVELLGKGSYAKVYKISIEDAKATCLKVFPPSVNTFNNSHHGRNIEVQLGLFLNQHSDQFVKMHFGKVCSAKRRDGFLVSQFLDENTAPIINPNIDAQGYKIEYYDNHKNNFISGKIIDYGGVGVAKY